MRRPLHQQRVVDDEPDKQKKRSRDEREDQHVQDQVLDGEGDQAERDLNAESNHQGGRDARRPWTIGAPAVIPAEPR